jgi:branched-chain amino acid transport system permease protein
MSFLVSVLTFTAINLIGVMGVFVLTGMTGLFSLGQASFMAIGAYGAGVLVVLFKIPFIIAVSLAMIAALVFGYVVGMPTIRLRRDYIALVTFGFGEAIIAILNNTTNITGGAMGLSGIPQHTTLTGALISALAALWLVRNFKYSKYGRQCLALKSDELAAKAMGIDVNRIKLVTFLFSAALTSYAGVLYGFYTTYVDPGLFDWTRSAEWIIIVFFGGIGSLTGAVVSAVVLGMLPEALRFASEWRIFLYSVIVIVVINFRPKGMFGEWELNPRSLRALLSPVKSKV